MKRMTKVPIAMDIVTDSSSDKLPFILLVVTAAERAGRGEAHTSRKDCKHNRTVAS